jgi:hypothetical protein
MKKILLLTVWFLSAGFHAFAGSNLQLQFTNISIIQNNWDHAYLRYSVSDLNTGQAIDMPSYMISYEIKDKAGMLLSKGSDIHMDIADSKLGSEEEYTIIISAVINGQELAYTICGKASPKKFAMKVKAADLDADNLSYTFTRPKFKNPALTENISVAAADVQVDVILDNTTYTIQAGSDHQALADQPAYKDLTKEMKKLADEGRVVDMSIGPRMIFRGQVYTDNQSYYQITACGIVEVSALDATASK